MKDLDFLKQLVQGIVEFPDEVVVERTTDDMGVLLLLSVNRADMGKIIGREGSTAKAIRQIMRVYGMKQNARINMKIAEPPQEQGSEF